MCTPAVRQGRIDRVHGFAERYVQLASTSFVRRFWLDHEYVTDFLRPPRYPAKTVQLPSNSVGRQIGCDLGNLSRSRAHARRKVSHSIQCAGVDSGGRIFTATMRLPAFLDSVCGLHLLSRMMPLLSNCPSRNASQRILHVLDRSVAVCVRGGTSTLSSEVS